MKAAKMFIPRLKVSQPAGYRSCFAGEKPYDMLDELDRENLMQGFVPNFCRGWGHNLYSNVSVRQSGGVEASSTNY